MTTTQGNRDQWTGIVKIQRPLNLVPNPQVLVYSQDRTIHETFPYDRAFKKMLSIAPKIYAHARLNQHGVLIFMSRAEEQPW